MLMIVNDIREWVGPNSYHIIVLELRMILDDYDGQWYPGTDGAYVFPTFILQLRKNPRKKNSIRKIDPSGDLIWAHYVRGKYVILDYSGGHYC